MIRTHLPRGYIWAAASEFQQTELFRGISYEDAEAIDNEQLLSDSEDEFPLSERILKRQRIEKLADDFLDGEELDILSARLDSQAVHNGLTWSFDRPKEVARGIADAEWEEGSQETWQDVDDDWDFLQKHCVEKENIDPFYDGKADIGDLPSLEEEIVIEIKQSSCHRRKSQRLARIVFGPSEDALRKAAELRNRKLRTAASDLSEESAPQSCPKKIIEDSQLEPESTGSTAQDSLSDCGPAPTPAWTSAMWRAKGAFKPPRKPRPVLKPVDQDCSRDELGLSSLSIPSQSTRTRTAARLVAEREAGTQNSENAAVTALISSAETVSSPASDSADRSHRHKGAVSTINEQSGEYSEPTPASPDDVFAPVVSASNESQEDSQTRLLKQQGILAKPRKSWATTNDEHVAAVEQESDVTTAVISETMPRTRVSILQSAELNATKQRKGRSTKSTGATPAAANTTQPRRRSNRRHSAPSESQKAAEALEDLPSEQQSNMSIIRVQYTESAGGKDSSPFVFRKRVSKFDNSDAPVLEPILANKLPTPAPAAKTGAKTPAKTPRRAVNFRSSDVSEKCQDPRTPLVNEHINQFLPRNTASSRSTRSLRSSLRQEMIASGAEVSRAEGEQSSQPEEPVSQDAEDLPVERTIVEDSFVEDENNENLSTLAELPQPRPEVQQQLWPGTQAMLAQAQHELFTSPDKTNSALYLGDKTTPRAQNNNAPGRQRRPLGKLSQEPMPSTQALLQDWQGWSSIKKPRQPGKRTSILQSPTMGKSTLDLIASDPVQSFEDKAKRRSSLRFSMSFSQDSPPRKCVEKASSGAAKSTALVPASFEDSGTVQWPKPSGKIASSASFGSGLLLSNVTVESQCRSEFNMAAVEPEATTIVPDDEAIVSLSFGAPPSTNVQSEERETTPKAAESNIAPRSSPKDISTWRSPLPVEVPEPFLQEEESMIGDLSFGPPDVGTSDSLDAPMPSYLMMQNRQTEDFTTQFDSQELRSTIGELAEDVLGTATTFSF